MTWCCQLGFQISSNDFIAHSFVTSLKMSSILIRTSIHCIHKWPLRRVAWIQEHGNEVGKASGKSTTKKWWCHPVPCWQKTLLLVVLFSLFQLFYHKLFVCDLLFVFISFSLQSPFSFLVFSTINNLFVAISVSLFK